MLSLGGKEGKTNFYCEPGSWSMSLSELSASRYQGVLFFPWPLNGFAFLKKDLFFYCVIIYLFIVIIVWVSTFPVCIHVHHVRALSEKRLWDALELESQKLVSCCVGAQDRVWIPCKCCKCS